MLEDKIKEAYAGVIEARAKVAAWKKEEKERMKGVKLLIQAERKFTPDFDGETFLNLLEAEQDLAEHPQAAE